MRGSGRVVIGAGLFIAAALVVSGKADVQKVSLTSSGRARAYWLFVPGARDAAPRPLILLLHGSTRTGETLVRPWKDLAEKEGIVLAGPDSLDSVHWTTPTDGPVFLRDVVDDVAKKTAIDPRRVYLFGHSAGACMALETGAFESNYFAAVATHAGAIPAEDFGAFDWAKRKIPYAFWIGTRDQFFALDWVRANRDALKSRGFPVEFHEMAGHDHNYYSVANEVNRQVWDFLKPQRLTAEPQFEPYGATR